MDMGRSVSFPFIGPAWLGRTLVGALLEVVPVALVFPLTLAALRFVHRPRALHLGPIVLAIVVSLLCRCIVIGYLRRVALGVLDGTATGLPAWDRFTDDLVEGLKLVLVMLGFWLPVIGVTMALVFLSWMASSPSLAWVPLVIVAPPAALLTVAYLPAALLTAIGDGELATAFDLHRINLRLADRWGPYLLAFLFAIAAEIFAQVGLIVFCAGIFATRFLAHAMAVHAFASVMRNDQPPGLPPPPATAPTQSVASG